MTLATGKNSDVTQGIDVGCGPGSVGTPLLDHLRVSERGKPDRLPVGAAGLVIVSVSAGLWWLIARLVW